MSNLPDNCDVVLQMKCEDCGHVQNVRGHRFDGVNYFGSGYDFCDVCDGIPRPIDLAKEYINVPNVS